MTRVTSYLDAEAKGADRLLVAVSDIGNHIAMSVVRCCDVPIASVFGEIGGLTFNLLEALR